MSQAMLAMSQVIKLPLQVRGLLRECTTLLQTMSTAQFEEAACASSSVQKSNTFGQTAFFFHFEMTLD